MIYSDLRVVIERVNKPLLVTYFTFSYNYFIYLCKCRKLRHLFTGQLVVTILQIQHIGFF